MPEGEGGYTRGGGGVCWNMAWLLPADCHCMELLDGRENLLNRRGGGGVGVAVRGWE